MGTFVPSGEPRDVVTMKSEAEYQEASRAGGESQDDADMARMGKRQQTRVSISNSTIELS
jgi:hypothetical protein